LKHAPQALSLDFQRGNKKAAIGIGSDDGFNSHTSSQIDYEQI
jgi:hypothetical protein